jgi:hypothetical protein
MPSRDGTKCSRRSRNTRPCKRQVHSIVGRQWPYVPYIMLACKHIAWSLDKAQQGVASAFDKLPAGISGEVSEVRWPFLIALKQILPGHTGKEIDWRRRYALVIILVLLWHSLAH